MDSSSLQAFYRGFYVEAPRGNNAFSFEQRSHKKIFVPQFINGTVGGLAVGEEVVFSDIIDGVEVNARGLKQFVHIERPGQDIFIFDNHNHAFSCWALGLGLGRVLSGSTLVHVDQHKDTRESLADCFQAFGIPCAERLSRPSGLDCARKSRSLVSPDGSTPCPLAQLNVDFRNALSLRQSAFNCVNAVFNVGNFISPAVKLGWFNEVIQVGSAEAFAGELPESFVLDIDMDIFAPVMDYIPEALKIARLREWVSRASFITIATSPFFMDQKNAIDLVRQLLLVETT